MSEKKVVSEIGFLVSDENESQNRETHCASKG